MLTSVDLKTYPYESAMDTALRIGLFDTGGGEDYGRRVNLKFNIICLIHTNDLLCAPYVLYGLNI